LTRQRYPFLKLPLPQTTFPAKPGYALTTLLLLGNQIPPLRPRLLPLLFRPFKLIYPSLLDKMRFT